MSSWHPTGRNGLQFVAEEFWPGGGENGDGRDLYGVAKHEGVWREETTDADLVAEALHPSDADYFTRVGEEEFDRELNEMETEADPTISVDGQPLDEFLADFGDDSYREFDRRPRDEYDDLPDGEDGPDTFELAMAELQAEYRELQRLRWNEGDVEDGGVVPSGPGVAATLERFEQDGITKIGMRHGIGSVGERRDRRRECHPNIGKPYSAMDAERKKHWNGRQRYDSWKRHREAQYRTRHIDPRILDRHAA